MSDEERNEYYAMVQRVNTTCLDLTAKIKAHSGETWVIKFTRNFMYRLINTDPKEDYGWYGTLDEVRLKLDRLFPLAGFMD